MATTTDSPAAGDGASSSEVATPSSTTSKAAKPSEPTPPVYSSGVIEMEDATGRIALFDPNWGTVSALAADIVADADLGLTASNGASFAVVPEPSYAACRDADYSVQALSWEELPSSTTVCIRSNDTRVGTVQVVWKENSGGGARDLTVRGVIWEPEH